MVNMYTRLKGLVQNFTSLQLISFLACFNFFFSVVHPRLKEEGDLECLWIFCDLWGNKIGSRTIFLPWSSKESWKKAVSGFGLCHTKWMWRKIWILGSMTGKKIHTCFQFFPWPLYSSIVPIRNLWLKGFIQNLYKT